MIEQILEADRHLQVDQVKQARDIYARVVELDPANAIAVVGLARCALAEGDDERAYELASQALEIDSQNDMARRMEARLSEILTLRGEEVARPDVAATPGPQEMRPVVTDDRTAEPATEPTPAATPDPKLPASPAADVATIPALATADSTKPTTATRPTPSPRKERLMRKSLIDRLLGR